MLTLFDYNYRKQKRKSIIAVILYLVGIVMLIGIDQLIKYWAAARLPKDSSINVIGKYVRLTYVENKGAAFSILQNQRILLIIVPAVLSLAFICVIISRRINSVLGNVSFMLIAAGGIGNLIDRAVRTFVVDYIDFNVIHFAIFNFADCCVTIGVALLVIFIIMQESNSERRKSKSAIFTRRRF